MELNTRFCLFFWLRAISCLIFGQRYIVFMGSLPLKQLLNLYSMASKNFNLVLVNWHKSKTSWDIWSDLTHFFELDQAVAEFLPICILLPLKMFCQQQSSPYYVDLKQLWIFGSRKQIIFKKLNFHLSLRTCDSFKMRWIIFCIE